MNELAKKRLSVAENPSVSVEHSPMKQFFAMALLSIDEPLVTTHPSHITPAPINTPLSDSPVSVLSLIRLAPLISVPAPIHELVISSVLSILAPVSMRVRFGMVRVTSSITILFIASFACLLLSVVESLSSYWSPRKGGRAVIAAIWLVRALNSTTLPSPASFITLMVLPCPKVVPSVVCMVKTLHITQLSSMSAL